MFANFFIKSLEIQGTSHAFSFTAGGGGGYVFRPHCSLGMCNFLFYYYCVSLTPSNMAHSVWKSPKMSHLNFSILAFSINFCPIKSGLSGNTVWMVASVSQKLVKLDHFWWIFVHSKCKRSSLRMLNATFWLIFKHCEPGDIMLCSNLSFSAEWDAEHCGKKHSE